MVSTFYRREGRYIYRYTMVGIIIVSVGLVDDFYTKTQFSRVS